MTLGEKIKKLRIEKGLTQKELADEVHVTFQTVSKWEKDENEPDVATLRELSKIFSCSIDDLLNQSDEVRKEKDNTADVIPVVVPVKAESTGTEVVEKQLHICEYCHKEIPEEELTSKEICTHHARRHRGHSRGHSTYRTAYYHKDCLAKERASAAASAKAAKAYHASSAAKKCWGWSIPAGIVALVIVIVSLLSNPDTFTTGQAIGYAILSGYGMFAMIYCILSGSYIGEVFLWAAQLSIKFPGIIFSFDLDGLKFLILMKILFAVLGFLIGVGAFLLAIVLSSALSMVSFPFILIHNIRTGYDDAF